MINKFDKIPDELSEFKNSNLDLEQFADDINGIFPINGEGEVTQSFANINSNPYKEYSRSDVLYMLDRVCDAADKFDVNLQDLLEPLGGEEIMNAIDTNSPEFQKAVKAETDKIMVDFVDKDKRAIALKGLNDKIIGTEGTITKLQGDLETVSAEKEKAEQDLKEYKESVEASAKIRERIDALKEVGMEQEDWQETEEAVAEMSEKVFAVFKNQVIERIKSEAALHNLDKKGKKLTGGDDDDKDKKDKDKKNKNPFAKSSTDIVKESKSEGALPNGEDKSDEKDLFPELTKAFERSRNRF